MNKSETSKQKQGAVEQLRESENLYQLFTENSLDVILLTAPDWLLDSDRKPGGMHDVSAYRRRDLPDRQERAG